MNKIILALLVVGSLSVTITGCGTRTQAVGTASGTAAGAGIGFIASGFNPAGAAIGAGVGAGVGGLAGTVASDEDVMIYRQKGVVYRNGVAYRIQNGRYVTVQ
ncbi:glycine zipper domain-containing protein [Legionella oakridgensis]|uniref:Uncharacterized protein n=2 Tax=Legionella oakridgensis TaxID=29423 RepID=W0B9R7_9GAMM|nr:glycine zipper domain-containing protein [Legionella oakridgensis]AHE66610.1 hypothetical protein Loa_01054 [Legionella oakridgensis ATCC 33761 = DSM 21215]ETO93695.1 glycine zipper [Legionella oakridgensis RV-2-2007]KTD37795.1 hypothetical protein Loak_1471 [Legionella oakridgensis]STY19753.1 Uncharacterised protein [Legionella longbeachae]